MVYHSEDATYVESVTLDVKDFEAMDVFYREVLGFERLTKEEEQATYGVGGKKIITLQRVRHEKERGRTGMYHFALLLPSEEALGLMLHHLRAMRQPISSADHFVSKALYLQDAEGNGIEIYADTDSASWVWEDGRIQMGTEPLNRDELLAISASYTWHGLPEGTILGHLHMHVSDIERDLPFYEALGFSVVATAPRAYFLSTNRYHHHIAINEWQGKEAEAKRPDSAGFAWATISYPDEVTRQRAIHRLRDLHVMTDHRDEAVHVVDPSMNAYRLVVRQ